MNLYFKQKKILLIALVLMVLIVGASSQKQDKITQGYFNQENNNHMNKQDNKIAQSSKSHSIQKKYCTQQNYDQKFIQEESLKYSTYLKQLKSYINIDGSVLITTYIEDIFSKINHKATQMINDHHGKLLMFYSPFVIGLIIMLIITIYLVYKKMYTVQVKLLQKQSIHFTRSNRLPLVYFVILIIIIFISSQNYSNTSVITKRVRKLFCSIFTEPNMARESNEIVNIQKYAEQISSFQKNLTIFSSANNKIINIQDDPLNQKKILLANRSLKGIMNISGSNGQKLKNIYYQEPFQTNSTFSQLLGTFNTTGLLKQYYTQIKELILPFSQIWQTSNRMKKDIKYLNYTLEEFRQLILFFHHLVKPTQRILIKNIGIQNLIAFPAKISAFYYLGIIVCSIFVLISSFAIYRKADKVWLRMFNYFGCLLWILVFIGFIILFISSYLLPYLNWGCDYYKYTTLNENNLREQIINTKQVNLIIPEYLSACIASGHGDISKVFKQSASKDFQIMQKNLNILKEYNLNEIKQQARSLTSSFLDTINNYGSSSISDLSNPQSIYILEQIASAGVSKNYKQCLSKFPNFAHDCFLPSNHENSQYINCKIQNKAVCEKEAEFLRPSQSLFCYGRFDTAAIFHGKNKQTVLNMLKERYSDSSCNPFSTKLANIWKSYYLVKENIIGNIYTQNQGSVYSRARQSKQNIEYFLEYVKQENFDAILNSEKKLTQVINQMNSKDGSLKHLDCSSFGKYISQVINSICVYNFNTMYETRSSLAYCCFLLLVVLFLNAVIDWKNINRNTLKQQNEDNNQNSESQNSNLYTKQNN